MQTTFNSIRSDHQKNPQRPTVWVSGCILGHKVRFDGGHQRKSFIARRLSETVNLVPLCREYDAGLGRPRESIKLVKVEDSIRAVGNKTQQDHTDTIAAGVSSRDVNHNFEIREKRRESGRTTLLNKTSRAHSARAKIFKKPTVTLSISGSRTIYTREC